MYVCMHKNTLSVKSVNIRQQSKRHMMQIDSELLNCCLDTVLGKIHFWEILQILKAQRRCLHFAAIH